jgi:hypothetical protein
MTDGFVWVDVTAERIAYAEEQRAKVLALMARDDVTDKERPFLEQMLAMAEADVAKFVEGACIEELRRG